jgi:hypothetical protein
MADSVALLRRKVEDTSLAVQDGTMNSVITLAAIEVRSSLELALSPFLSSSKHLTDISRLAVWQGQYQGWRNAC